MGPSPAGCLSETFPSFLTAGHPMLALKCQPGWDRKTTQGDQREGNGNKPLQCLKYSGLEK